MVMLLLLLLVMIQLGWTHSAVTLHSFWGKRAKGGNQLEKMILLTSGGPRQERRVGGKMEAKCKGKAAKTTETWR